MNSNAERQTLLGPKPMEISDTRRKIILLLCIGIGFLGTLDLTLVATCLQPIASELHESTSASWIATGYLWSTTTFTPLYGRLSDHISRKHALVQALVLFGVGTALCGFADSVRTLALARFLAGMGGGGQGAVVTVLLGDLYRIETRGFYQGLLQLGFAAGLGLGGIIGGSITGAFGWRAAFLVQVPAIALMLIAVVVTVPYKKPPSSSWRNVDFLGSFSLLISIGCLLIGLSFIIEQDLPPSYPPFIVACVGFVVFLAVFVLVELRFASHPIMPLELLQDRTILCVGAICGIIAVVNFTFVYFLPVFFELVMGKTAAEAGAHLAPNALAMCIGSPLVGYTMKVTGRYKWVASACCFGPLLAMLLISTFNENTASGLLWFSVIPMGLGFSGLLTSSLIAAQKAGTQAQLGAITSFIFLFRSLGQVLGVAASSAIYQATLTTQLHKYFGSEALIERLRHSSANVFDLPTKQRLLAQLAFKHSLRNVFYFAAAGSIVVFLASLPIPDRRLDEARAEQKVQED